MTGHRSLTVIQSSFFERLNGLEAVLRAIMWGSRLSALIELRGEQPAKVLIDYVSRPGRIGPAGPGEEGQLKVAVDSDVMHLLLLGHMAPGEALGQRHLLLRGSPSKLGRFVSLFDFAPALYRDHLADAGIDGFARAPSMEGSTMSQETELRGDPIVLDRPGPIARLVSGALRGMAFLGGYCVGVVRYRLLRSLSVFDVLAALSRGLAAATPKQPKESKGP